MPSASVKSSASAGGKAYSYIRFSSPEQAKGRSVARQREDCERYCKEHGLVLATEREYTFLDAGRSGFKGEHIGEKGQLARFLSLVKSGDIERGSTLIVESLDRLSRQHVRAALVQFLGLLEDGICIVTLADGQRYDAASDERDLILSIFVMSRAHEESATKSRRIRDAMKKKHELARTEGRPMGRITPLWLEVQTDEDGKNPRIVEKPERVAVVRRIFELAIEGRGKGQTAKILNAEGVQSFKGKTWGPSSVDKVLKNRAVLGEYIPHSVRDSAASKREALEPIKDYFPRVIEEATFYAAQQAGEGRRVVGATKQTKEFNVWAGVAKCSHCGAAMHIIDKGRPPRGMKYLQCYGARKGLCPSKLVRLDHLEGVFRAMLARLDALALVKDSGKKIARELAAAEAQHAEKKKEHAELLALLKVRRVASVLDLVAEAADEAGRLGLEVDRLKRELATEEGMSFRDFVSRLEESLSDYAGRSRANALLHRLGVTVRMGPLGFVVMQEGQKRPVCTLTLVDGVPGYLVGAQNGGVLPEFVPFTEAGIRGHASSEDASQAAYDAIEDEGQPAGEY